MEAKGDAKEGSQNGGQREWMKGGRRGSQNRRPKGEAKGEGQRGSDREAKGGTLSHPLVYHADASVYICSLPKTRKPV